MWVCQITFFFRLKGKLAVTWTCYDKIIHICNHVHFKISYFQTRVPLIPHVQVIMLSLITHNYFDYFWALAALNACVDSVWNVSVYLKVPELSISMLQNHLQLVATSTPSLSRLSLWMKEMHSTASLVSSPPQFMESTSFSSQPRVAEITPTMSGGWMSIKCPKFHVLLN